MRERALRRTVESDTRTRGGAVDETYRMLGREREADLEREARRRRLAAAARAARSAPAHAPRRPRRWRRVGFVPSWLAGLVRVLDPYFYK